MFTDCNHILQGKYEKVYSLSFEVIINEVDRFCKNSNPKCFVYLNVSFVILFWQAVWVFTVSLSVIFINAPGNATVKDYWTAQDIVGLSLFVIGLLMEAVSDQQKFLFRNNPANKGKWCQSGTVFMAFNFSFNVVKVMVVCLQK